MNEWSDAALRSVGFFEIERLDRTMKKPPLLLLHAALGSAAQLAPLAAELEHVFDVLTLDFEGHGASGPVNRPMSYPHMSQNVLQLLDELAIESLPIFGHSMGGYVGLYLAVHAPDRVSSLHTLGSYFEWDEQTAGRVLKDLDVQAIALKVPAFAQTLELRHTSVDWRDVVHRTYAFIDATGAAPALALTQLGELTQRVRVGVGDRDNLTSVEAMVRLKDAIPNGELAVFPRTGHSIERAPLPAIAQSIIEFASPKAPETETK